MSVSERLEVIKENSSESPCTFAQKDGPDRHGYSYSISDEDFDWLISTVEILKERNEFLEKAHKTNIKIAEYAQEENNRYKQALEELDNEFESLLHYGFEGNDHLWRSRRIIEKALEESK